MSYIVINIPLFTNYLVSIEDIKIYFDKFVLNDDIIYFDSPENIPVWLGYFVELMLLFSYILSLTYCCLRMKMGGGMSETNARIMSEANGNDESLKFGINIMRLITITTLFNTIVLFISFILFKVHCISYVYKYYKIDQNEHPYEESYVWIMNGTFGLITFLISLYYLFTAFNINSNWRRICIDNDRILNDNRLVLERRLIVNNNE
jgi:hypothetical protein